MIVAKDFKTYNRRFSVGDTVSETDDLGDKSFETLVKDGYLTSAPPAAPPVQKAAAKRAFMPLATPSAVVATPNMSQEQNDLRTAWNNDAKVDDKVVFRINEPNGLDTYGVVVEDTGDVVAIQVNGEASVRYYFVRNVDRDNRIASGTYGHLASGADQQPDKA